MYTGAEINSRSGANLFSQQGSMEKGDCKILSIDRESF